MEASLATDFITVHELAARVRTSKMTVYRLVHAGVIPSVRIGRNFRIAVPDAENYIRSCQVTTAKEET